MISAEWFEAHAAWVLGGVVFLQLLKLGAYGKNLLKDRERRKVFQERRHSLQKILRNSP